MSEIATPEKFPLPGKSEKTEEIPEEYDGFTAEMIKTEEKINIPVEIEHSVRKRDNRIKNIRECSFSETVFHYRIINSEGLDVSEKGTIYTVSISPVAEENGNSQIVWGFTQSRYLKEIDLDGIIEETVKNATGLLKAKPINTTELPVLFPPYAFSQILQAFYPAFSGEFLIKKKNILNIGDIAGVQHLNITDDGRIFNGVMTRKYDDEGTPTQKTKIIKNGIMENFLHSIYTAVSVGKKSTGNGFRSSYRDIASVKPSNLFVETGNRDINYPDRYFYVVEMLGLHTANPVTGDFSVGVSGFVMKGDEIFQPVMGVTLSGNFFEMLKSIIHIGR
ncbi:MAG: TldD/PmbA family protein [Persephonella sp.]|nr:TldD/PmbA family protein [Persephonella sp.]